MAAICSTHCAVSLGNSISFSFNHHSITVVLPPAATTKWLKRWFVDWLLSYRTISLVLNIRHFPLLLLLCGNWRSQFNLRRLNVLKSSLIHGPLVRHLLTSWLQELQPSIFETRSYKPWWDSYEASTGFWTLAFSHRGVQCASRWWIEETLGTALSVKFLPFFYSFRQNRSADLVLD